MIVNEIITVKMYGRYDFTNRISFLDGRLNVFDRGGKLCFDAIFKTNKLHRSPHAMPNMPPPDPQPNRTNSRENAIFPTPVEML